MKRIIAIVLTLVMAMALAACGSNAGTNQNVVNTNTPAGTTAGATAGTTGAAADTTAGTEAAPTEEPTVAPTEEPTVAPTEEPTEPAPAEEYFVKSGTPTLGEANGNLYANASIGLTIAMAEGVEFVDEATILELNGVSSVAELKNLGSFYVAVSSNNTVMVMAAKLGSSDVDNLTDIGEILLALANDTKTTMENNGVTSEQEEVEVILTAGVARGILMNASNGNQVLYFGYQVGDYVVCVTLIGDAETMLEGVDVE